MYVLKVRGKDLLGVFCFKLLKLNVDHLFTKVSRICSNTLRQTRCSSIYDVRLSEGELLRLMVFLGHVKIAGMSLNGSAELPAKGVHTAVMLLQLDQHQCLLLPDCMEL